MKKYDLHKNNFSKLHFELHSILPYYLNNKEKASRPHRHNFFQLLGLITQGNTMLIIKSYNTPKTPFLQLIKIKFIIFVEGQVMRDIYFISMIPS